jgi:hypothetical protein
MREKSGFLREANHQEDAKKWNANSKKKPFVTASAVWVYAN